MPNLPIPAPAVTPSSQSLPLPAGGRRSGVRAASAAPSQAGRSPLRTRRQLLRPGRDSLPDGPRWNGWTPDRIMKLMLAAARPGPASAPALRVSESPSPHVLTRSSVTLVMMITTEGQRDDSGQGWPRRAEPTRRGSTYCATRDSPAGDSATQPTLTLDSSKPQHPSMFRWGAGASGLQALHCSGCRPGGQRRGIQVGISESSRQPSRDMRDRDCRRVTRIEIIIAMTSLASHGVIDLSFGNGGRSR